MARIGDFVEAAPPMAPEALGAEAFDRTALSAMARRLQPLGDQVHAVRIGGNDILNLLGVRRSRTRTAYDGPLGLAIATMASVFLPEGMALSAMFGSRK